MTSFFIEVCGAVITKSFGNFMEPRPIKDGIHRKCCMLYLAIILNLSSNNATKMMTTIF